jgi:hypothetical protein
VKAWGVRKQLLYLCDVSGDPYLLVSLLFNYVKYAFGLMEECVLGEHCMMNLPFNENEIRYVWI